MSMFNDIGWPQRGNSEKCISNSEQVKNYAKRFSRGHWTFPGPGDEKMGTELSALHLKENGIPPPQRMCDISKKLVSQHSTCRDTIHFNADSANTELFFRTIHSANQLSIFGAVSSWCAEFVQRTPSQKKKVDFGRKLVAKENDQLLVNVKPQEVNSFVQTPRSENGAPRKQIARMSSEIWNTGEIQFYESVEMRHSRAESLLRWAEKLFLKYMIVLETDPPSMQRKTLPCENQNSRIYANAAIPGQTLIGTFFKFISYDILASVELKFRFFPRQRKSEHRGWWCAEEKTATWRSYISIIQTTSPQVLDYFWREPLQKNVNFVVQRLSNPASRKLMRRSPEFRRIQCAIQKKWFLLTTGNGMTFLLVPIHRKYSSSRSLKIGHENGTALWSRWKGNRRRCSFELDVSKPAKSFPEGRRVKILGNRLA